DNSVSLVYLARVLQSAIKGKDIAASPNADVLSFRSALARAKVVSLAANQHLHLQMKLAEARDTILHKTLAEFDAEGLEVLRKRDLFPLIKKYSEELDLDLESLLGEHAARLGTLAAELQESID